jgi:endonuclease YncB( thermonuclease family)
VARVIDADTFACEDGNHVRLLLVDAPEMNQGVHGPMAKAKLSELLPVGTSVELELDVQQRDRYGRVLAHVYTGPLNRAAQTHVNRELVRSGMALVSVYPPNVMHVERLRAAADSAREARAGLWATSAFECAPADHRAGRCK